jgi:hypothetical protein
MSSALSSRSAFSISSTSLSSRSDVPAHWACSAASWSAASLICCVAMST